MGQRVGFERVTPGSAAREAELEKQAGALPTIRRIQAGSAARAAEEAKKAGVPAARGMPTFSLRAQGVRVERVPSSATVPSRNPASTPDQVESAPIDVPAVHTESTVRPSQDAPATTHVPAQAAPQVPVALKTFLRRLLFHGKPSQP
jgi:hypothetical protein